MIKFKAISPFTARYPLYSLRKFEEIYERDNYVIVRSKFAEYILDCKTFSGSFSDRRIKLLAIKKELPLKLYPLKERFSYLGQLANSKKRWFIDEEGNITRYKPSKFYHINYVKVLRADRTWNGYYRLMTKLPVAFVTEQVANYVGYIQIGSAFYLYELSNEKKATSRKKI